MEKSFGQFLSEKRKEAGLTQKELANMIYISESAVSKWEKDRAYPEITLLPTLATILKVSEHELITASVDVKHRTDIKNSKKWKVVSSVWEMFFYISYGIALLTCFIVDLCTSGTLSWFWIVFFAILLAASFTTIPKFIKKYRLLLISLIELLLLILLLGVCCIFTNGDWFMVTVTPITLSYLIVFLPIFINVYNFPKIFKKNNALISLIIDFLLVLVMIGLICVYTNGFWFFNFAVPVSVFVFILPLTIVLSLCYLKTNAFIKTSSILLVSCVMSIFANPIIQSLLSTCFNKNNTEQFMPNFNNWQVDYIGSNVIAIISIVLCALSVIFLILGILKSKNIIKDYND